MSKTTDIHLKDIQGRLRGLRDFSGLTQKELGDKFGLSSQSISGYENGDVVPDIMTLLQYATYFKIKIEELLSDTFYTTKGKAGGVSPDEYLMIQLYRELPEFRQRIVRELIFDGEKYEPTLEEEQTNSVGTKKKVKTATSSKSSSKTKKKIKNERRK